MALLFIFLSLLWSDALTMEVLIMHDIQFLGESGKVMEGALIHQTVSSFVVELQRGHIDVPKEKVFTLQDEPYMCQSHMDLLTKHGHSHEEYILLPLQTYSDVNNMQLYESQGIHLYLVPDYAGDSVESVYWDFTQTKIIFYDGQNRELFSTAGEGYADLGTPLAFCVSQSPNYEELEKKHLGDSEKQTGIYHPDVVVAHGQGLPVGVLNTLPPVKITANKMNVLAIHVRKEIKRLSDEYRQYKQGPPNKYVEDGFVMDLGNLMADIKEIDSPGNRFESMTDEEIHEYYPFIPKITVGERYRCINNAFLSFETKNGRNEYIVLKADDSSVSLQSTWEEDESVVTGDVATSSFWVFFEPVGKLED
jgi:hypothetical protein